MRVLVLLLISSAAYADVPDACKDVATPPPDAKIETPKTAAKIAGATCGARQRMAQLKLAPDDASIQALTNAAKPSLDALDAVIKSADPVFAPIASRARADLLVGMAVRMRNSIPPITMTTVGQPIVDHEKAHAEIETKIKPWLDQAK